MDLQVIVINRTLHSIGRPEMQTGKVFVIRGATHDDRHRVRGVLNSDRFRGKFGVTGSTQESLVVLYCDDPNFDQLFTELFAAITDALVDNDQARA